MIGIKFRGLTNQEQEWVTSDEEYHEIYLNYAEKTAQINGLWVNYETVTQFTGLKDELGNDIFENDILEYLDGEYSFRAIVKRDYHQWYLKGINPIDNYSMSDFAEFGNTDLKIIGNIYQNPELL